MPVYDQYYKTAIQLKSYFDYLTKFYEERVPRENFQPNSTNLTDIASFTIFQNEGFSFLNSLHKNGQIENLIYSTDDKHGLDVNSYGALLKRLLVKLHDQPEESQRVLALHKDVLTSFKKFADAKFATLRYINDKQIIKNTFEAKQFQDQDVMNKRRNEGVLSDVDYIHLFALKFDELHNSWRHKSQQLNEYLNSKEKFDLHILDKQTIQNIFSFSMEHVLKNKGLAKFGEHQDYILGYLDKIKRLTGHSFLKKIYQRSQEKIDYTIQTYEKLSAILQRAILTYSASEKTFADTKKTIFAAVYKEYMDVLVEHIQKSYIQQTHESLITIVDLRQIKTDYIDELKLLSEYSEAAYNSMQKEKNLENINKLLRAFNYKRPTALNKPKPRPQNIVSNEEILKEFVAAIKSGYIPGHGQTIQSEDGIMVVDLSAPQKKRNKIPNIDNSQGQNTPNDSPQNAVENIVGDVIEKGKVYEKYEMDPLKRMQEANKRKWQEHLDKVNTELAEQLAKKGQVGVNKQMFVYQPAGSQELSDILRQQQFQVYAQGMGNVVTMTPPQQMTTYGTVYITQGSSALKGGTSGGEGPYQKPQLRVVRSPIIEQPQAPVVRGPGSVHPMLSTGGRVAGAYIGVFMMAPQIYRDGQVILSPKTTKVQKGWAALDIAQMGAGMWAFGKFVMEKHPQVGAGIMMGTAAYHGAESIEHYLLRPYLQKAEFGQTGQRLIFTNEQDYFNHRPLGPSCTDGRKPVFLNKKAANMPLLGQSLQK